MSDIKQNKSQHGPDKEHQKEAGPSVDATDGELQRCAHCGHRLFPQSQKTASAAARAGQGFGSLEDARRHNQARKRFANLTGREQTAIPLKSAEQLETSRHKKDDV